MCVDGPSVCGSGSMSLVLCFFLCWSIRVLVVGLCVFVFTGYACARRFYFASSVRCEPTDGVASPRHRRPMLQVLGGVRFEHKGRWEILIYGYSRCLVGSMDVVRYFSVWLDG